MYSTVKKPHREIFILLVNAVLMAIKSEREMGTL